MFDRDPPSDIENHQVQIPNLEGMILFNAHVYVYKDLNIYFNKITHPHTEKYSHKHMQL